jgi:hypothetical protein
MDAQGLGPDRIKLAVVELLDRDGHVRQFVPVWQWPVTIGRAIDCDVVLDDPNAAPHHATVTEVDGTLRLVVDETLNGVSVGRRRYAAQQTAELAAGDVLAIGSSTRLSVRRAADPLAPERSIAADAHVRALPVVLLALVYMALIAGRHWVMVDPGGRLIDDLLVVVGSMLALAAWTGFWAVGSKLVRHRFDLKPHAQVALSYTLGSALVATILPQLAFASGVAFFSRVSGVAAAGVIWAMVLAHLTLILPARQRFLAVTMALLFSAGVSLWVARTYQNQERFFDELYVTTMAPPSLRLAPAEPAAQFISDARRLKAVLDAHVHDDRGDAGGGSDEQE